MPTSFLRTPIGLQPNVEWFIENGVILTRTPIGLQQKLFHQREKERPEFPALQLVFSN